MYNVDDAIAKIDGYVISVSGGGAFVGEKKMIRIDDVKRTAAYASLIGDNGEPVRSRADGSRGRKRDEAPKAEAPAPEAAVEHAAAAELETEAVEKAPAASRGRSRGSRSRSGGSRKDSAADSKSEVQSNGATGKRRRGRRGGRRRSSRSKGSGSSAKQT